MQSLPGGPIVTENPLMNSYALRRSSLVRLSLFVAILFAFDAHHESANAEHKNVVVFLVDDLGYMDVGCNNPDTFYETPHIDRLAKSGMRFTDGYAACPVCSPTRFSLMTGRYPSRVNATNYFSGKRAGKYLPAESIDRMPLEETTIAEALKNRDYATFFAGKWHLGPNENFWPEKQGFDVNKGGIDRGGPYGGKKYFSPYGNPRLENGPDGEHLPDRLATETAKFIEDHKDGPFFAYLSFYSVHTPLMAPQPLVDKYKKKAERLGLLEKPQFAEEEQVLPIDRKRQVRIVQSHAVYAAMVESMDRAVGKVLDRIDELGLTDSTVVILTSDNGGLSTSEGSPTSNLPLRGGKGWLYEGGIREVFLIRAQGLTTAGDTSHAPVSSIDVYPTILDFAGASDQPNQRESRIDGVSLVPLLKGGETPQRFRERPLFWHYPHYANQGGFPGAAVRIGDWKLIERFEDGRVHLYNLQNDVGEKHDLSDEHPDRVERMRKTLHDWYQEVDARFLRKNPDGPEPWRPEARRAG